jgi:ATP phosphoribosyltransferase
MISIALPKGSLEEQTLALFREADLAVRRTDRDYSPVIRDERIGKVTILRPQEIPLYVAMGYYDLGISGLDWVHETEADVVEVAKLNYSKTGEGTVRIVVAVHAADPADTVEAIGPGSSVCTSVRDRAPGHLRTNRSSARSPATRPSRSSTRACTTRCRRRCEAVTSFCRRRRTS